MPLQVAKLKILHRDEDRIIVFVPTKGADEMVLILLAISLLSNEISQSTYFLLRKLGYCFELSIIVCRCTGCCFLKRFHSL